MRLLLLTLFTAFALSAQPTDLRVDGTTPTQVVLSYKAPSSSACTISTSPAVNDVDDTLFPGSDSDAARAITVAGRRTFVLGTRTAQLGDDNRMYSRALAADSAYAITVTCGSGVTVNAHTAQIRGFAPDSIPYSADAPGGLGYGQFDLTDTSTPIIDPHTGAKTYAVFNPKHMSHAGSYTFESGVYFGGSGWTSPANITDSDTDPTTGSSYAVSPSATDYIASPIRYDSLWIKGYSSVEQDGYLVDLALNLRGSGSDATAENRKVELCISVDSGQSCYSNLVEADLQQTTAASVGTVPTAFPTVGAANASWTPFGAWGVEIPRKYFGAGGSNVTVASGVATVDISSAGNGAGRGVFRVDWASGSKIYIAGSSPTCTSNYCTIDTVDSETQITLVETGLSISNANWSFAGVVVRISKKTVTGTISLSASYKIAKSWMIETGAEMGCSPTQVSTTVTKTGGELGRTITGRLCIFNRLRANLPSVMYFVGESEPEFRLISVGRAHSAPGGYDNSLDWFYTASTGNMPSNPTIFSPSDATIIYYGANTSTGGPTIFKGVYGGDFSEFSGLNFKFGIQGDMPTYADDNWDWTNEARSSTGNSLRDKILASDTEYSEADFGSLTTGLTYIGTAKSKAVYAKYTGSQENTAWIFVFDLATAAYEASWHTLTGPGTAGHRYAGVHSASIMAGMIVIASNGLDLENSARLYGGPFVGTISHTYKSGSANTDSSLPQSYDGSYDGTCPSDIDQEYKDHGATGNNCATLRFTSEPCSSYATTAEKALTPCPGDATKSYIGVAMAPGDEFYDSAYSGDGEHFLVVKRTAVSGNIFDVVVLRDAGNGYCNLTTTRAGGAVTLPDSRWGHSDNWTAQMTPRGSCIANTALVDPVTRESRSEHQAVMRGHFGYELATNGNLNFVGIEASSAYFGGRYNSSFADIGTYDVFFLPYAPSFNSVTSPTVGVQSYVTPGLGGFGTDMRHINSGTGTEPERQTGVGPTLTITSVGGQSNTFKVTGFTAPTIKVQPLLIWYGFHVLSDMSSSSTGNLITDSNEGRFCYAYRVNECRTGSSAGDLYVVAPGLNTAITTCRASQVVSNALCVFPANPLLSSIAQFDSTASNVKAARLRTVGMSNTIPGAQYSYTHVRSFSSTSPFQIFGTQNHQQGLWSGPVLIDPGRWDQSSTPDNNYRSLSVSIPAVSWANQARVRFGYADYGTIGTNFYCTKRAEDCVTDASLSPYGFIGDSLTATTCSSGCAINIPAIPGRVLVYRIERLNSGTLISTGPLEIAAIP